MKLKTKTIIGTSLATTAAVVALAPQIDAAEYTIKFGDTLSELAVQFNTTIEELRDANSIQNVDKIYAGESLTIDAPVASTAVPEETTVAVPKVEAPVQEATTAPVTRHADADGIYTVVAGDTLSQIAESFGTTVQAIRDLNSINGDLIIVGQKLLVNVELVPVQATVNEEKTTQSEQTTDVQEKEATPSQEETPSKEEQVTSEEVAPSQEEQNPSQETSSEVSSEDQTTPVQYNESGEYVVASGDTLNKIANKIGVSVAQLKAANGLSGDLIYVGQALKLEGEAPVVSDAPSQETGVVTEVSAQSTVQPSSVVEETQSQPVVQEVSTAPVQQVAAPTSNASGVVGVAANYIGTPYVWGGSTPSGFDCSGLTSYVYRQATGKEIGRVTTAQENSGTVISVSEAQPGDLLFWGSRGGSYHVAIYAGNGQYIHSPQPGQSVTYATISAYFAPSFAVRVA